MKYRSPIMQMYYHERGNFEMIRCSKEGARLAGIVDVNDRALEAKLEACPEILALYQKTNESLEDLHSESADNIFAEGFRFGLLMGLDAAGLIKEGEA